MGTLLTIYLPSNEIRSINREGALPFRGEGGGGGMGLPVFDTKYLY